ncbi:MAG TPA: DUF1002 domain-containing protein [Clostridia bacterium]|jgi:uncharacterized protein YpuA (DUF1002 family)|nr:DUF1002 domain-containing protein [Clostridia bacterium]
MKLKKVLAAVMAIIACVGMFAPVASALEAGQQRVTIGADLDDTQRAQIYKDFGLERGTVTELTVTNKNERAYLEGLVPDGKIGSVALSCVYITTLEEGSGLDISTNNINWCTSDMYKNALTTAGIADAKVMISAPFPVSGTAALTGIYKAYEDITGQSLSDLAKSVGAEELIVTGQLAEYIGSEDATEMINQLKGILDQTQNMTDDEVRSEIRRIADDYNVAITDAQVEQLLGLCRQLEKLDVTELKEKLLSITQTVQKASQAQQAISNFATGVKNFFTSIGNFFSNLFGGK